MGHLLKTISRVKRTINPNLKIGEILLTLVNQRTNFSKETLANLKENFGSTVKIYENQIPFGIKVAESTSRGKSIFLHDKNSRIATAYDNLSKEVSDNGREQSKDFVM